MSEWRILHTLSANEDVKAIHAFIAAELEDSQGARRVATGINDAIGALSDMPLRYRLHPMERFAQMGIRYSTVGSYAILFRADEALHEVHVLRILHEKQDMKL